MLRPPTGKKKRGQVVTSPTYNPDVPKRFSTGKRVSTGDALMKDTWLSAERDIPLHEGYLKKKSGTALMGKKVWNVRYFVLMKSTGQLLYFQSKKEYMDYIRTYNQFHVNQNLGAKSKGPQGLIPVDRIRRIEINPLKKKRFIIKMENDIKIFALEAPNEVAVKQWIMALESYEKGNLKPLDSSSSAAKFWKDPKKVRELDPSRFFLNTPFEFRMSESQLRTFASFFTQTRYTAGTDLFGKSKIGAHIYVIVKGTVEMYSIPKARNPNQEPQKICNKGPADIIGLATLKNGKRIATARVVKLDLIAIEISCEDFSSYLKCEKDEIVKAFVKLVVGVNPHKLLRKISLFRNIEQENEMRYMGCLLRFVHIDKNEVLFHEGATGRSMYVILDGEVKAVSIDFSSGEKKGAETRLCTLKVNDCFGEISVLKAIPRTASIIANKDSSLVELRKDDFLRVLRMLPQKHRKELESLLLERMVGQFQKYDVAFFRAIPPSKYPILARLCELVELKRNSIVCREGEVGDSFYLVVHGRCNAVQHHKNEESGKIEERIVGEMGPGKYFGEISLVKHSVRTATVICKSRCVLLRLSDENFSKFFTEAPEALSDFEVKLARKDVQLRSVLYHPVGLKYFESHLAGEYSGENLEFWKECRAYRKMKEHDVLSGSLLPTEEPISQTDVPMMPDIVELNNEEKSKEIDGLNDEESINDEFGRLQNMPEYSVVLKRLQNIYEKFIKQGADLQVNLMGNVREQIEKALTEQKIDDSTLDAAAEEIQALMSSDSFGRFKVSPKFEVFLEEACAYENIEKVAEYIQNFTQNRVRCVSASYSEFPSVRAGSYSGRKTPYHKRHQSSKKFPMKDIRGSTTASDRMSHIESQHRSVNSAPTSSLAKVNSFPVIPTKMANDSEHQDRKSVV